MEKVRRKQTLVLKTGESHYFEEAHFILRENGSSGAESEMMREANRILAAYEMRGKPTKKEKKSRSALCYFIWGMICGLLFVAVSAVIFSFLV